MTWKIVTKPEVQLLKLCNECGKMIDVFNASHPVTQHMILTLGLDENSDLSKLDFGLQPYHWCPITENNHCLIPLATTTKERIKKEQEEYKARMMAQKTTQHDIDDPEINPRRQRLFIHKGRLPTTALEVIRAAKENGRKDNLESDSSL